MSTRRFQSPRSVFYYGRGGAQNLSCILRFEPGPGEGVRLTFTRLKFGDRPCSTQEDARTGRWKCLKKENNPGIAELWVSEYPWPGIQLPRDCVCSRLTEPITFSTLMSSVVEVNFTITLMNITQDFNDFHFEGEYQFVNVVSESVTEICAKFKDERRLRGSSGEVAIRSPIARKVEYNEVLAARLSEESEENEKSGPVSTCSNHPWLIEPEDMSNNYLYLKIRGYELLPNRWRSESFHCSTMNRIFVYSGVGSREPIVVCPTSVVGPNRLKMVEVFSDGWNRSSSLTLLTPHARSFVVEFLEREPGSYAVSWMEVSKRPLLSATSSFVMSSTSPQDCPYR